MARFTETRDVSDFTEIVIEGFGDTEIEQVGPDGIEYLEVEADEAILSRLKAEVKDGRLYLGLDLEWWEWLTYWATWMGIADKKVRYRIAVKTFEGAHIRGSGSLVAGPIQTDRCELSISGSGKIRLEQLEAKTLRTTVSGSGDFTLGGAAERFSIQISGSGDVRAIELVTQESEVHISGSGKVQVHAERALDVHISGSGEVHYLGSPRLSQHIAGAGSIKALPPA